MDFCGLWFNKGSWFDSLIEWPNIALHNILKYQPFRNWSLGN
jgi:hypothetical protein